MGKQTEKKKRLKKSLKKRLVCSGIALCLIMVMYLTVVYSNISWIAKWRTIYIETAMTTNSHQWLATFFFPQSVIDEVMEAYRRAKEEQREYASKWDEEAEEQARKKREEKEALERANEFFEVYWEMESLSFRNYLKGHPKLIENGYGSIYIEDFDEEENISTVNGDSLLVLDTANNLMILKVKGEGYQGKLAIVKNPKQIELAKASSLGYYGQEAGTFGKANDALLVINASGFTDAKGEGSGGDVKGSLIIDGVDYGHPYGADWKFCGFKKNNLMYITNYSRDIVEDYRWAIEFYPALIVDGVNLVEGTYGMGMQPRSAIGQAKNGDFLMLIVDGRQPGYSIGCTVTECAEILEEYHAYQAMNLDGGSSAVMWYNGEYITKSSSVSGLGRYMPDALIVKKAEKYIDGDF